MGLSTTVVGFQCFKYGPKYANYKALSRKYYNMIASRFKVKGIPCLEASSSRIVLIIVPLK